MKFVVRNVTRDTVVGWSVVLASSSDQRRTGLLKHKGLGVGEGLWIVPCEAIHTFFMKFAIDVLYVDRKRVVRKTVRALGPWKLSGCWVANSVLELPAGVIDATGTQPGDQLEFVKIE